MTLQLEKVSFGYTINQLLLKEIDLSLDKGNVYVLMGANGAGKTTLFNIINGYLKKSSGDIKLNNQIIYDLRPYIVNRLGVARTFQDSRLAISLTVKENILLAMKDDPTDYWLKALLPRSFYRLKLDKMEDQMKKILDTFFLKDVADKVASDISYGQQKLLLLACAYANEPTIMLLDEPVSGINREYREQIASLFAVFKNAGMTILMIEHVTDFINLTADYIYFLAGGQLYGYPTLDSFRSDPFVIQSFF